MYVEDLSIEDVRNFSSKFQATGFQLSKLLQAVKIAKEMKKKNARIYFTFTANMVASGLRGLFAELCKKKFVDVVITTAGGIEHDFIKTFGKYEIGEFEMNDVELHTQGINRIGNILVPTKNYVLFEKKIIPIFEELWRKKKTISPSELSYELGKKIKDRKSFLYWCTKKDIPVFCPGIVDGALGLQTYFFKQKRKNFAIDVTKDMEKLASLTLNAKKTGGIILGGGISKHYAIGVNILRGGFDYAVYITTAQQWDGSLSGARSKEAISWGKITEKAKHVTVDCEATIAFPLFIKGLEI